jgi:SAM-dependent methyltransferase
MILFALTIFTSAFLLFQVQPLIARFILPWFGGSPTVWTTCMLFFQFALLLGYLYADLLTRWFRPRAQIMVHALLVAAGLLLLPIIPADSWKPTGEESPTWRILLLLGATIGLPYFLLSTTGPLVQAWFARRYPTRSPYRLFALSNFGSLLALISYPLVFEPAFATRMQAVIWGGGFIAFSLLVIVTGWYSVIGSSAEIEPRRATSDDEANEGVTYLRAIIWLALSMVPSVLLLATTNQICQEVAVVPFLWILPLSLYLISFIVCFDKPHWYSRDFFGTLLIVSTAGVIYCLIQFNGGELFFTLFAFLTMLFSACMTCHGELALLRPAAKHLTFYYLMISIGGALGGLFVVLVAPQIFLGFYELHWALFAAVLLTLAMWMYLSKWNLFGRLILIVGLLTIMVGLMAMSNEKLELMELIKGSLLTRSAIALGFWFCTIALIGWLDSRKLSIIPESFPQGVQSDPQNPPIATSSVTAGRFPTNWAWLITLFVALTAISIGLIAYPDWTIDYCVIGLMIFLPLLLIFAIVFQVRFGLPAGWKIALAKLFSLAVLSAIGIYLLSHGYKPDERLVTSRRDFYGLLRVKQDKGMYAGDEGGAFEGVIGELVNGRILHGFQFLKPDLRMRITSYYGEGSGVGLAIAQHPARLNGDRLFIGVVGLGTGTLAAWTRPADKIVFYEINPEVEDLARNQFFYLTDSEGENEVILGDARIRMERQLASGQSGRYDVLAIDAFSSDAIPRHLLTQESFELYRKLLKPDGILAVHVSNRYLDLRPITYSLAEHANWTAKTVTHNPDDNREPGRYQSSSTWILVTNNEEFWQDPVVEQDAVAWESDWRIHWTDDFGSLVQVLRPPSWLKQPKWWPWKEFWPRREE